MFSFKPGNVLAVDMGPYLHVGVAGDRLLNGEQTVIENSKQTGRVQEVPLSAFAAGRRVADRKSPGRLAVHEVLERARSKLGTTYDLFVWNCEHFTSWAHGQRPHSPQIEAVKKTASAGAGLLAGVLLFKFIIDAMDGEYDATVGRVRGSDGRFKPS